MKSDKSSVSKFFELLLVFVGLGNLLGGCVGRPAHPPTTPVTVRVIYRGEPVEGAYVMLVPQDGSLPAAKGVTDVSGLAKPRSFPQVLGVLPGKYLVVIHKRKLEGEAPASSSKENLRFEQKMLDLLPVRYGDAAQSGLNLEVPAAGMVFETFTLVD